MYIIAEKNKQKRYNRINAIFKEKLKADLWYLNLPDNQDKAGLNVYKIPVDNYPLYILSNVDGKEFFYSVFTDNLSFIEKKLKQIQQINGDQLYANLYCIKNDCVNETHPAESCIGGKTDHIHIDNSFLSKIKKNGIQSCFHSFTTS